MKTGYQVEPQTESFSTMAVAFAQDTKYLQPPNHIFNLDPLRSQLPIHLLFCLGQMMQLAVFQRQNHVPALSLQAPISQITTQPNLVVESDFAHLIQLIIVRFAFAKKCRNYFFGRLANYQLRLQTVPLAFSACRNRRCFFSDVQSNSRSHRQSYI